MIVALWVLPAVIVTVALFPMLAALRALADEAAALKGEIHRTRGLRPALVDTRTEVDHLRAQLRNLGTRPR